MAKTPRRRVPVRQEAGASTAQAAAHASRAPAEERRPAGGAPTSLGAPTPRPAPRRGFKPFGWLARLQPRFVGDIISELRKVTWPTFADTRYLTFVVAVVAIAVGLVLGMFDLAFGWIIERLFFD